MVVPQASARRKRLTAKDQIAERMATSSKARSQGAGRSQLLPAGAVASWTCPTRLTFAPSRLPSHDWPLGLSSGRRERRPTRSRLGTAGTVETPQTHWKQRS